MATAVTMCAIWTPANPTGSHPSLSHTGVLSSSRHIFSTNSGAGHGTPRGTLWLWHPQPMHQAFPDTQWALYCPWSIHLAFPLASLGDRQRFTPWAVYLNQFRHLWFQTWLLPHCHIWNLFVWCFTPLWTPQLWALFLLWNACYATSSDPDKDGFTLMVH